MTSFNSKTISNVLVLKIRIANSQDPDFIETELPHDDLTYNRLVQTCCDELNLQSRKIIRIRKLPNTKLRNDQDVGRLENFQEIEIVTDTDDIEIYNEKIIIGSPVNGYQSISKKDQTILY